MAASYTWCQSAGVESIRSPFEADHPLDACERAGITSGSICDDSDLFIIGSKVVLQMVNLATGECNIVRREVIIEKLFRSLSHDDIIAFGIFWGVTIWSEFMAMG